MMVRVPFWLFVVMMYLSCTMVLVAMLWAGPRIRWRILGRSHEGES